MICSALCNYTITITGDDLPPPQKKKNGQKFFGQICHFVNYSYTYFPAKMYCPQSLLSWLSSNVFGNTTKPAIIVIWEISLGELERLDGSY